MKDGTRQRHKGTARRLLSNTTHRLADGAIVVVRARVDIGRIVEVQVVGIGGIGVRGTRPVVRVVACVVKQVAIIPHVATTDKPK